MKLGNQKGYEEATRDFILKIHKFAVILHTQKRKGQRTITYEIKKRFNRDISEHTISGWIHRGVIPFGNERTQFKPKPVPPKRTLERLYVDKKQSASEIAKIFRVSVIIAINWLKRYNIQLRTHTQSMNTPSVKQELRKLKLKYPSKEYGKLTSAKAYILGVLCGDGYIDEKNIKLEIRKDEEFITAFSNAIQEVYGLKYNWIFYEKRKTLLLAISSMLMAKDLLRYGNFRTWTWSVPQKIMNNKNMDIITSFIRGVYDSEASVGNYNINFTTVSSRGANQLRLLLHRFGIATRMSIQRQKYYTIFISGKKNIKRFDILVGFTILRKREKLYSMYKRGWEK